MRLSDKELPSLLESPSRLRGWAQYVAKCLMDRWRNEEEMKVTRYSQHPLDQMRFQFCEIQYRRLCITLNGIEEKFSKEELGLLYLSAENIVENREDQWG